MVLCRYKRRTIFERDIFSADARPYFFFAASNARFSSSTFTRGSPRKPSCGRGRTSRRSRSRRPSCSARLRDARRPDSRRASGEMSGSMPLALEVTRSIGIGQRRVGVRLLRALRSRAGRVDQLLRGRAEVRAAGRGRIVAVLARGRRPALEILRLRPELPDDVRADELAVDRDDRTVGLIREDQLARSPS